ncbi:hypothetical protein ACFE04_020913 [Oxalis oulophora]
MTRNIHSEEVSEVARLCRPLSEQVLYCATSFIDFKCYSNKTEASLVASKKRGADLHERVILIETWIKKMEEEKISQDNENEGLHQKVFKLESDVKQVEGNKNVKISSLERSLARVWALVSVRMEDIGNDVET